MGDSGESGIRFVRVATSGGVDIDLVLTNITEYHAAKVERNGLKDCFGLINVLSPSSVSVLFRFVNSGTNDSAAVDAFFFSVYDLDESKEGIQEEVTFNTKQNSYFVSPDSG